MFLTQIVPTIIMYWSNLMGAACFFILSTTLHEISMNMGVDPSKIGILYVFKSLGMIVGSLFCGRLCDIALKNHGNPKKGCMYLSLNLIGSISAISMAIPIFLHAYVTSFWIISGLNFIIGVAFFSILTNTTVTIKQLWIESKLTYSIQQGMHFFFSLGSISFPLFTSIVYSFDLGHSSNCKIIFITAGFLTVFSSSIIFFPLSLKVQCKSKSVPQRKTYRLFKQNIIKYFKDIKKNLPRFVLITQTSMYLFSVVVLSVSFGQLIFQYSKTIFETETESSIVTMLYYLAVSIGRLLAILKTIVLSPVMLLALDISAVVLSMLGMIILPKGKVNCIVFSILVGLFHASNYGTAFLLPKRFGVLTTGFEDGLVILGGALGEWVPFITNYLMVVLGADAFIYVSLFASTFLAMNFMCVSFFGALFKNRLSKDVVQKLDKPEHGVSLVKQVSE